MPTRTDAERVAELKELLAEVQYRLWHFADVAIADDLDEINESGVFTEGLAFGSTVQRLVEDALSVIRREQHRLETAAVAHA